MEPVAPPSNPPKDLDLFGRVIQMETANTYRDMIIGREMDILRQRVTFLEQRPPRIIVSDRDTPRRIDASGWVKILVALLLPLSILLAGGSSHQALQAGRMIAVP